MVSTRSSRDTKSPDHSHAQTMALEPGEKRKTAASPSQDSRGTGKKQRTLEDTMIPRETNDNRDAEPVPERGVNKPKKEPNPDDTNNPHDQKPSNGSEALYSSKHMSTDAEDRKPVAIDTSARQESTPKSILEKGLIYFFFRGRVGIDDPSDVGELARSYIVLRPIPHGAGLKPALLDTAVNKYRVLALPKKVLPTSPRDRFMVFVEHASATAESVKENVLRGSDYTTKTAGTRHTPAATPIASGVYAIINTGRDSHLAYMLTLQTQSLNEVQVDVGLREKGSFVVSAKNPQYEGPANTNLPKAAEFPSDILEDFRSLRWAPLQPRMLDYQNAQILLIGANANNGDLGAMDLKKQDESEDLPINELEKLEGEAEIRASSLEDNNPVFEDLALSHKDYGNVQTSW